MASDTETDKQSAIYESDNNNLAEAVLRVAHQEAKKCLDTIAPKPRKRRSTTDVIYEIDENDDIFVGDSKDSVATILKNEALKLCSKYHNLEYNDQAVSFRTTSQSLNSILDLTPQNRNSDPPPHNHLYDTQDWNKLIQMYQKTSSECNIILKYEATINEIETVSIYEYVFVDTELIDKLDAYHHPGNNIQQYYDD
ncbi:hypothetical protein BDA99DRAFT_555521 [Phascolomyces articulosus]|uniref:Uncharacterized protein n=1 Tax=Phascolomyces articulosus TaxID=60185 RepID=A0AAD5KU98_9FUNG|nr:hypothetical protein BDA99DRAFT_555521 [Phascolomyces articulosus]